jgi:Dolichyl-phosphate-mannose-protein mannosyltransferase
MNHTDRPPEPRATWRRDLGRIVVILVLAVGVRTWMVANTTVPSRDCIVFVRYALNLESPPDDLGSRIDVVRKEEHPPGYPAAILVMSWLVRSQWGDAATAISAESMGLSAQLVSAVSGVLLAIPFYLVVRRVFDSNTAFAAVAIYEVLPVFVEVTSDGISDGLFLWTAVSALWFAVRALESSSLRCAGLYGAGAGACCGLGYLVRPDGLIVAAAIGLTFAGVLGRRLFSRHSWRFPLGAGIALVLGTAGVAGPYMCLIGGLTNKPAGKGLSDTIQGGEPDKAYFDRSNSLRPVNLPIAAWWDPVAYEDQTKSIWAAKSLFNEYLKAAHYAVPWFALVGLAALWRRWSDARVVLLLAFAGVHACVLYLLAWKIGYVSQRHTLPEVLVTCVFAAASFPVLGASGVRWWRRGTPWSWGAVWAVVLIAAALPRDFRSLHSERAGHKAAGKWLATQDRAIEVVDPFGWAEWYAGRTLRTIPNPDPRKGLYVYAVFEPNSPSPHSRLGWYDTAKQLKEQPDSEPVFEYPPGVPKEKVKVAVYKCQPLKP